jgi:5-methylcytosine-specific restriction endonuclease McrA
LSKRKIRCDKIAKEFQGLPCFICETTETTTGAHLWGVGAHPGHAQNRQNIMPLCWNCHWELDKTLGLTKFVEKYWLQKEMTSRGFVYCDYKNDWFIPE